MKPRQAYHGTGGTKQLGTRVVAGEGRVGRIEDRLFCKSRRVVGATTSTRVEFVARSIDGRSDFFLTRRIRNAH